MNDFTITGEFASTEDKKDNAVEVDRSDRSLHFNYDTFSKLMDTINNFLNDNLIADKLAIEITVPHESFRVIDSGIKMATGDKSDNKVENAFIVQFDETLTVMVNDEIQTEDKNDNG